MSKTKNYYYERKEKLHNEAVDFQMNYFDMKIGWADLIVWQEYFRKLGKRYGLMREFRENGIC